jgi:hypothetical protein
VALNPHSDGMDKHQTRFEPIQMDGSRWYVLITLPRGVKQRINYFNTEDEARTWIDENSAAWLVAH